MEASSQAETSLMLFFTIRQLDTSSVLSRQPKTPCGEKAGNKDQGFQV